MKQGSDSQAAQQREQFFGVLERHGLEVLADFKMPQESAGLAVAQLISLISKEFGGAHIYVPTDYTHRSMEKAMAMYNDINGRNFGEVARKYGCSERTVYRIYKRMRTLIVSKTQVDMFN